MTRRIARLAALAVLAAGCASAAPPERGLLLRRLVASTVQLRAEREGGVRRSASGVVVASDPARARSWVLTTRHFVEPEAAQQVYLTVPGRRERWRGRVAAVSREEDLAVVEVEGLALPAVALQDTARLGGEIWLVSFPWGRRLTVVSGVVSQIAADEGAVMLEGAARMVDAPASYGASGGGVFDAATGGLIGIVEGYRTARVTLQTAPERTVDIPVPGETTVLATPGIRRFLRSAGVEVAGVE